MAAGSNFVVCLVDAKPAEQIQYFATEIGFHESAPERRTTKDGGENSRPDRTSVTAFHEFDQKEMFAVLSETRLGGAGDTGHFDYKSSSRH